MVEQKTESFMNFLGDLEDDGTSEERNEKDESSADGPEFI
jgi:hypothetical protein